MTTPGALPPVPSPADVARVAAMTDLAARNREVTRGYVLLSQRLRRHLGDEISWPTMAAWASAQAGRTIRKEDLLRALERRLGDSPAVRRLVEGPFRLGVRTVLDQVLKLDPFDRSSQAVARGNIKVYEEIGAALSRFVTAVEAADADAGWTAFVATLRPGPPPEGQDELVAAFSAYRRALAAPAGSAERSQAILTGNLGIGYHEQVRLQPDILGGVDGAVLDGLELKDRLLALLVPQVKGTLWALTGWLLRWRLDPYLAPLVTEIQRAMREIVTERMMVLELAGEVLRLGDDLTGTFPPALRTPTDPALRALLTRIDRTPDSLLGTGTGDWTDFGQRIHFIADLFRSRQGDARLFAEPG